MEYREMEVKVEGPRRFLPGLKTYATGTVEVPAYGWDNLQKFAEMWFKEHSLDAQIGFYGYAGIYLGVRTRRSQNAVRILHLMPELLTDFEVWRSGQLRSATIEEAAQKIYVALGEIMDLPLMISVQSHGGDATADCPLEHLDIMVGRDELVERLTNAGAGQVLAHVDSIFLDEGVPVGSRLVVKVDRFPEVVYSVHSALEAALSA